MSHETFIRRVKIRHYKSIGQCNVELGRVTMLVGRNASGKSNFLDAIELISDGLRTSFDHAIRSRGGIYGILQSIVGHPRAFAIQLDMNVDESTKASYAIEVESLGKKERDGATIKREALRVFGANGREVANYVVEGGIVNTLNIPQPQMPPAASDRLYLVTASGLPQFRPIYDSLLSMGFYNPNPTLMKEFQHRDTGELLRRDGSNIARLRLKTDLS